MQFATVSMLRRLGSLQLTLAAFIFLAAGILIAYFNETHTSPWLIAALALLATNLLAAILTRPHFQQQKPLLFFHLFLLLLIVLIAYGRLSYLSARVEVLEGNEFSGVLTDIQEGPWHRRNFENIRFLNLGFNIAYGEGLTRLRTFNRVSAVDEKGQVFEKVIGDHVPLVLNGYRFYATWNKGFALLFDWQRPGLPTVRGSINLPSYPANAFRQAQKWVLPGMTEPVWVMLQLADEIIKPDQAGEFQLPDRYRIVVRYGEQRFELPEISPERRPDAQQVVDLPGGRLNYVGVRAWMGYKVSYDPTLSWLLAVAVMAVLSMAWHFWQKFTARPWNE